MRSEDQRKAEAQLALSELSQKLAGITDPKLRNSSFVRFVQKLSSGQVVIKDDQAVEVGAAQQQQQQAGGAEDWAGQFDAQQKVCVIECVCACHFCVCMSV